MAGTRKADPRLAALGCEIGRARGRRLWRSLDELADAPEFRRFLEAEFPALARRAGEIDRRNVLRLMGASLALAGLAACDQRPRDPIVARDQGVPGHTPSVPLFFATTLDLDGYGRGVLVESHDGWPTKIEGNPLHPASLGATDAFAQADVLTLYDPDRSRTVRERGRASAWDRFESALAAERAAMAARRGEGLRILSGP
jgi:MoCo/4Fe-4S cofactor protein with predicted Tat translocation signal